DRDLGAFDGVVHPEAAFALVAGFETLAALRRGCVAPAGGDPLGSGLEGGFDGDEREQVLKGRLEAFDFDARANPLDEHGVFVFERALDGRQRALGDGSRTALLAERARYLAVMVGGVETAFSARFADDITHRHHRNFAFAGNRRGLALATARQPDDADDVHGARWPESGLNAPHSIQPFLLARPN